MEPKLANRLYLFRPSDGWTYCGGATLLCAASLDEAIMLGNQLKDERDANGRCDRIAETDHYDVGFIREGRGQTGAWVFVEEFVLLHPRPVGLVFTDANYA